MVIIGISALSITPLCCTCLEELSFPIPESLSINWMFFTSNLISLFLSILVTMPQTGLHGTWILVGTIVPFSIYILFWYKTDFLKSAQEGVFGSFRGLVAVEDQTDDKTAPTPEISKFECKEE